MAVFVRSIFFCIMLALRDSSSAYTENKLNSTLFIIAAAIRIMIAIAVSTIFDGHTSPTANK